MKKTILLILCAALLLCVSACGKNVRDKAEAFTMSPEELTEALEGVSEEELVDWWGMPSSFLSGLYGSIWTLDGRYIVVYFNSGSKIVTNAICGELDENGFIS